MTDMSDDCSRINPVPSTVNGLSVAAFDVSVVFVSVSPFYREHLFLLAARRLQGGNATTNGQRTKTPSNTTFNLILKKGVYESDGMLHRDAPSTNRKLPEIGKQIRRNFKFYCKRIREILVQAVPE
jgi:hypothetical protein